MPLSVPTAMLTTLVPPDFPRSVVYARQLGILHSEELGVICKPEDLLGCVKK